jgi:hypothetical protein
VYIPPQTTATTTCRRHNHASRAEQDHHESTTLAPSPDRSLCDKQHKTPAHNHPQSHLRQPATLCTGETFLDSVFFATTLDSTTFASIPAYSTKALIPSPAPSSLRSLARLPADLYIRTARIKHSCMTHPYMPLVGPRT